VFSKDQTMFSETESAI